MGGTVALEMAQQLKELGEEVGLVAMFDSFGPHFFEFAHSKTGVSGKGLDKAVRYLREFGQLQPRDRFSYVQDRVAARISSKTKGLSVSSRKTLNWPLPHELRYWDIERHNVEILLNYQPQIYSGRIALFRAMEQPEGIYPDPAMGWSNLAQGGFEIMDIGFTAKMEDSLDLAPRLVFGRRRLFQIHLDSTRFVEIEADPAFRSHIE